MAQKSVRKTYGIPKTWQVVLLLSLLALSFQNCGQSFSIDSPSAATDDGLQEQSDADFFTYPYAVKPEFMGEIDLVKADKLDAKTYDTATRGVVVKADSPATAVSFEIHLLDANNVDLCPVAKGTTGATTQTMISTCIANKWGSLLKVRLLAYSATQAKMVLVRERLYRGL